MREARYKLLYVPKEKVAEFLGIFKRKENEQYTLTVCELDLPDDVEVVDVYFDWQTDQFAFKLYSEQFPKDQLERIIPSCRTDTFVVNARQCPKCDCKFEGLQEELKLGEWQKTVLNVGIEQFPLPTLFYYSIGRKEKEQVEDGITVKVLEEKAQNCGFDKEIMTAEEAAEYAEVNRISRNREDVMLSDCNCAKCNKNLNEDELYAEVKWQGSAVKMCLKCKDDLNLEVIRSVVTSYGIERMKNAAKKSDDASI